MVDCLACFPNRYSKTTGSPMASNPNLYQINTRVRVRSLRAHEPSATPADLDSSLWDLLAEKGFEYVWLMGIWKTCETTVEQYCFEEGLTEEYGRALPDWKREDVIGSPYAIDVYEVSPHLGSAQDLLTVRSALNQRGMKLVLDFVPNHFSAHSQLITSSPGVFLAGTREDLLEDGYTFYVPPGDSDLVLAHGRDPYFPAWQDTVQVNYADRRARAFMTDTLLALTELCDGVRCDMAMLALNEIFAKTWAPVLERAGWDMPQGEFWNAAIRTVKERRPDFLFMAETYWDLEWRLQQLGFDYTYDKKLTDRLRWDHVKEIRDHLLAESEYQQKSVRFLENHDEERAVSAFGEERSRAAAVITGTLQGMHLYYDGQFEGKAIRLPVQLVREPAEPLNRPLHAFYDRLLNITKGTIFKAGQWALLETHPAWDGDESHVSILAWLWRKAEERILVVVNYSGSVATCRIRTDAGAHPGKTELVDLLHERKYLRSSEEMAGPGLYIELERYQSHIFRFTL